MSRRGPSFYAMDREHVWGRVTVIDSGGGAVRYVLWGRDRPGLETVDVVARLTLFARRRGSSVRWSDLAPELDSLLELCGLRVEVVRETEGREESLGPEEGEEDVHGHDLPA
jgi:hypothetical protein